MGRSMQVRSLAKSLEMSGDPERLLTDRDPILGRVISSSQSMKWPGQPTEPPIWGLVRIAIAQQVSTAVACRIAERLRSKYPQLASASPSPLPDYATLRALGLPGRRAQCCVDIFSRSGSILAEIKNGSTWDDALQPIKGIGPWTIAVFKIMVLRDPDVLPTGDVGLERAVTNVYGEPQNIEKLSENWRPFRSIACWYLWRTLGNQQLG
jgi:DNA-3-methyladenine glycosylase II